ncbi:MAG: 16S rRNA (cytosine(967)-C(5))-methyltransferase [Prochlorotrichaceae cyanobacterium]
MVSARHLAWTTLMKVYQGAYADVALQNSLKDSQLLPPDRALMTELVYGCVRRQRTLDTIVQQLSSKPQKLAAELRVVLQIGLYQLRYLSHIPAAAAVHTTVELCKSVKVAYGVGFVNAVLRQYLRRQEAQPEVLSLPPDPLDRLGILHSYPRWILETWETQLQDGAAESDLEQLCEWFNRPPRIDLRVNPLRASLETVQAAFKAVGTEVEPIVGLPQALTLPLGAGAIPLLPGFAEGHWMVQDRSAQLVSHWLDPQPGETIADACAAPGGKTLHLAELLQNQGTILAYDRTVSRLKKLRANLKRLGVTCIDICQGDSQAQPDLEGRCDRVLVDAPCSGLGTLHRHADARWTQTAETVKELADLQGKLLRSAATWVKPGGVLVYATCTLHPAENEHQIAAFLEDHPQWSIDRPPIASQSPAVPWFLAEPHWLKLWPPQANMDGFFIVRLRHG